MRIPRRTEAYAILASLVAALLGSACVDGDGSSPAAASAVHSFANSCQSIRASGAALLRDTDGSAYSLAAGAEATPFFFKPSGLGTYLLYDEERGYVVGDGEALQRATVLESDVSLVDDAFESPAEWRLELARGGAFFLRQKSTGLFLAADGLAAERGQAAVVTIEPAAGCADFPEESTHSEGEVVARTFADGDVFGFSDTHSHILANFAFGGGGIFHGAPFHPLGVEHALGSCEPFHGADGRRDLFGAGFDTGSSIDLGQFVQAIINGQLSAFNHHTEGYPEFREWPAAPFSSTHQTQYYKWIERAYRGGLRLVVQHAVSNQVICDFLGSGGIQPIRYSCNDMVAVDRQIDEIYRMQDYIDAQEGGPGQGWFRIVTSPAQAREVIRSGKLAVVLGIETSNLFNCFLVPREGFAACTEETVEAELDDYYDRGVRVVFPVHKYDNGFSAGDGQKGFIELGNAIQTGHFSSFTTDCDEDVPAVFDGGRAQFPGINRPREDFFAPAPNDFTRFFENPLAALGPFLNLLLIPPSPNTGDQCQIHGLTNLGEFLIRQMMERGMLVELDHLPRKSYKRAFEILAANDYPGVGTHGNDNFGKLYDLGGVSKAGFSTCRSANRDASVDDGFQNRVEEIVRRGGYPGLGFGLDLNGFAGARGPRFGDRSGCREPQSDPVTYPFTSYAGDVVFHQPQVGNRTLDFNTEGLVHIGLLPEVIEDVRRDGVTDAELEPLFRSAEAYLRMWEKAERRAAGR